MPGLPRLYAITDTTTLAGGGLDLCLAVRALLEAGVRLIQLRHKGHYSRSVFETAREISGMCRQAGAIFVIDDRADIARIVGAGLHVGQEDLAPPDARRVLGPDALLGYSTHNAAQLAAGDAEPVDYLAIGPIFPTDSKENPDPVVGVDRLRELRKLTAKPLVAIGGITRENALRVLEAGADAVAVLSDLIPAQPTVQALRGRAEQWIRILE
ncbi:MAG: thiamine phosphate synthase [Acidobacteria bacterium]|nr:thiamine phosphate synthase [Acidobacteriota bacterium]